MSDVVYGSVYHHRRTMTLVPPKSRRRCRCGCKTRATHMGQCNGVTLVMGCELYIRRWVRNWRDVLPRKRRAAIRGGG